MKTFLAPLFVFGLASSQVLAQSTAPATAPATQTAPPTPAQTQTSEEQLGAAPLRVRVNKSVLINTRDRLKRVSVTDPAVADAVVVSPTQVLVHGRSPGEVTLLLWDEQERS